MNTHHSTIHSLIGAAAVWALVLAAALLLVVDFENIYAMLASKLAMIGCMCCMPAVWRWAASRSEWIRKVERYIDEED